MGTIQDKTATTENFNLLKHIDSLFSNIQDLIDDIIKSIYNDNSQNNDNINEFISNKNNFAGTLYDIYYEFTVMKSQNQLDGCTLSPFHYPCYFDIMIDGTPYALRVTSVHNEFRMIYTSILLNNQIVNNELNNNTAFKNHNNVNSILNMLYDLKTYAKN
ncbi:hypothetical protein QKU48_gp0899 [Fadolivirus algeromassiliense]|jgi:hypothetical protein|uniref:Uncharacterized protein n=1 Tax=Fadolivirus FV1/VV64 TaxID=3070911 RepID=A0A7D3V906_9VIRU|nr:hypothetical protein QKU48_gp0899 [Fadolivirus algeromassiliense]QKF94357.1 hypothetical protein Fadolivirus_1_899 [Fadolivirus FV1/VV64]